MRALEKNILGKFYFLNWRYTIFHARRWIFLTVVSTIEPGRKQADSENGDSMPADIMLDSDVEKDMTGMSDSDKTFADNSAKATVSTPVATASTSDSRKETENGIAEDKDVVIAAVPAPNIIDAEPSLNVVSDSKDDAKLIDVEGGSDLQEDSIVDSSQDAEPHIDVVDDVKEKDPIAIELNMEVPDKPEEMLIADPTLDETPFEQIKIKEAVTEPDEMLQSDIDDAAKDAEMEEELLAEPVADVNIVDSPGIVIASVIEATTGAVIDITSEIFSPDEKINIEEENDFIFEPKSSKIPRLDNPEVSTTLSTEAPEAPPTEIKEIVTPVEEPTPTPQLVESAVTEDASPIIEEPVSSPLATPSENISSNESIKITEVAESDKTEFSTITSEPVINEPDSVTSPEPIKETENEKPTEICTTIDTPVEDVLTDAASEISDAVIVAEPTVPIEEVTEPVTETPAIIPETIIPEVSIPEKTEEMAVEEVETPVSVATSDTAMDAAPIISPVVEEIAAVITPTIVLETAAPHIVAAEDEQMEVDDTNSTDPMDL